MLAVYHLVSFSQEQVQDQLDGMRQLPELMEALLSSVER